jgi:hypothetical protein
MSKTVSRKADFGVLLMFDIGFLLAKKVDAEASHSLSLLWEITEAPQTHAFSNTQILSGHPNASP